MSWVIRVLPEYLSTSGATITLSRDEGVPVEWRGALARDEGLRIEWRASGTLIARDEGIPEEWLAALARLEPIPVEWTSPTLLLVRDEKIPVEWTGTAPGNLLLIWHVLQKLNTKLALQWVVISGALHQNLSLQWTVKQRLAPLTLRWNVIPPIGPPPTGQPGSGVVPLPTSPSTQDIQRPTSITQKTP